jgi:multidrug resistance efflux pump
MAATFSHSLRVLNTDGFRPSIIGLLLTTVVLGSWVGWALFARVTLYEVTDTARLEVGREVHPIQVSAAGRVVATRLTLGGEVQAGDVLVELDTEAERHRLEEERASLATLSAQLAGLRKEVVAEEQAGGEDQQAARAALDEARVQAKGAETAVPFAEEEVKRLTRLQAGGYVAELDLLRAQAEVQRRRTTANALRLEGRRLEKDQRTKKSDRKVRLERLNREVSQLEGQLATTTEVIERLAYEIEKRRIRAPAAGRLGEIANLRIGAFVLEGDRLGAIVPQGELRAVAQFLPPPALGRIQPGQPARMRLDGFPWTQYGTIGATVASVANEIRDGRVRVELTVYPDPASPIPFQHGLPGAVEVAVDRVSPATLLLRLAGKFLVRPILRPDSQNVRVESE